MAEHYWSDAYEHAVKAFGQTPRAEDEQVVIDAFERNPLLVRRQIQEIGQALEQGKIRWGWSALAKRVQHAPMRDVAVPEADARERKIRQAEAYVRNAGQHYDREDEIVNAVFGDGGELKDWRNDVDLELGIVNKWREVRPLGEEIERTAKEMDEHYRRTTGLRWTLERAGAKAAEAYAKRWGIAA